MANKQYLATIITPFHNTDMSIFMETYKSVKRQTVGFENIEWIIVLHNCQKEYIDAVRELTEEFDNVFLKELYNEARSAASPRNYGIQFVTSPYVEFLDSDDRISPNTVETCLKEMEIHHPDQVVFRMAYKKQNESVQVLITDVTLWNPMEKEIVLTGERLRCKELFSAFGSLVTHNRFFNTEFLRSNNLKFDEKITMAEDGDFTLATYAKSKKIVILPQFVGHTYFVNSGSAVQSISKPREEVLHFAYGFKKMLDLLIDIKAYYNHFFLKILELYLIFAYCSPDFTEDDWKTLREEMAPYARMVTRPPVNKFFPTAEDAESIYQFVVRGILDPPSDNNAHIDGADNLAHILRCNKDTGFGKYYGFEELSSIEEYRNTVPLYDHKGYDELIRIYTEVGDTELLSSQKITAYAYDFNESNDRRMVPMVRETCEKMGISFLNTIAGETSFLMMESVTKGMPLNDGSYADSATGIMVRSGLERFTLSLPGHEGYLTSPFSLIFQTRSIDSDYLNMLLALRNEDVTQIFGSNTWIAMNYIELARDNWERLSSDIEKGTISVIHNDQDPLYREIAAWNTPNPERAALIREAFRCEEKGQIAIKIWPKLKRLVARSGGNFNFYTKKLKKYLGAVGLEFDEFVTPFGIIADKTETENVFKLNTVNGFYEFIPAGCGDVSETKLMSELETGSVYEMILTNNSGIYRMHTGIYIRPVKISKEGLLFEECMKPLIVNGRYLCDGNEFETIIEECAGEDLHDYFFFYDEEEKRLHILIEPEESFEERDYSSEVQNKLMQLASYSAEAQNGLCPCRVQVIDKGIRLLWRDIRREIHQAPAECFLPVHFLENSEQIRAIKKLRLKD